MLQPGIRPGPPIKPAPYINRDKSVNKYIYYRKKKKKKESGTYDIGNNVTI